MISEPRVSDVRLPDSPDAVNYNLELTTLFDSDTFSGKITMTLVNTDTQPLMSVTLHAKELDIDETSIQVVGNEIEMMGFDRERYEIYWGRFRDFLLQCCVRVFMRHTLNCLSRALTLISRDSGLSPLAQHDFA